MRQVTYPRHQNTARTISCKAGNSPVEYPSIESKHDTKESEGNVSNPMYLKYISTFEAFMR